MRQRQPLSELLCCFVRSRSVKRHRCRRDARRAHQLGAPPIAGGHYLDEECAPADGFLKTMNGHLAMSALKTRISRRRACVPLKVRVKPAGARGMAVDLMQPVRRIKRSATRRRSPQGVPAPITETPREKKIYVRRFSTSFARLVHMFSTRRSDSDGCDGRTRG